MLQDKKGYWLGITAKRYAGLSSLDEASKTIGLPIQDFKLYTDDFIKFKGKATIYQAIASLASWNEITGGKSINEVIKEMDVVPKSDWDKLNIELGEKEKELNSFESQLSDAEKENQELEAKIKELEGQPQKNWLELLIEQIKSRWNKK